MLVVGVGVEVRGVRTEVGVWKSYSLLFVDDKAEGDSWVRFSDWLRWEVI